MRNVPAAVTIAGACRPYKLGVVLLACAGIWACSGSDDPGVGMDPASIPDAAAGDAGPADAGTDGSDAESDASDAGATDAPHDATTGDAACPGELCDASVTCSGDTDCSDGDACNGEERCVDAICQPGEPLNCDDGNACNGIESCDPATGCTAGVAPNCDDGDPCTADACDAGEGCVFAWVKNGTVCGDARVCIDGACLRGCGSDTQCNDADSCNGVETCVDWKCRQGTQLACDDGNACNGSETCNPARGCQAGTPLACDDRNPCNGAEVCSPQHGCQAGTPLRCDDGNACNGLETCDPAVGCRAGSPLRCDDGNVCNGSETCEPGSGCRFGLPLSCDDGNACTVDLCDANSGCVSVPVADGTPCGGSNTCLRGVCSSTCLGDAECDDGDLCNGKEICLSSRCRAGTPLSCNDGNVCTADACDGRLGCVTAPLPDGSACGSRQVCVQGICGAGCAGNAECDDANLCTGTETCVAFRCQSGVSLRCDDGNFCNGVERCDPSAGCLAGAPPSCPDDGNACTEETCDPVSGCIARQLPDATPCGDTGARCRGGVCQAAAQQMTISHLFRGAFNSVEIVGMLSQPWKVLGNSYQVRTLGDGTRALQATRSYFTFDLQGISGTVTAAALRIAHPQNSFQGNEPFETVELYDVHTPSASLQSPPAGPDTAPLAEIYRDLGTGQRFASFAAGEQDNGSVQAIALDAAAVQSLNRSIASGAGEWSIGATLASGNATAFGATDRVFRGSDESGGRPQPATLLVLDLDPAVP